MSTMRGAVTLLVAGTLVAAGCGGGGAGGAAGSGGRGAGGTTGSAGGGAGGGAAGASPDAATTDAGMDLATDFAEPASDVAINCPTGAGALAPAAAAMLIDDFQSGGRLDGRSRVGEGFVVKEQFDATADARFEPTPGVEAKCGAAAPGAAHIRGAAADTGATFALIFSGATGDGGKPANRHDASATKGVRFRVALGDAKATKLLTVSVNQADSQWDYTKDVIVNGTVWQDVEILWTDLQAAPAAPKFSAAALNQIVFPFIPNADVDFYLDDFSFF
jgi:hypothetical protein